MATKVTGELYEGITGQLFEIGRQLRQPNGYPFDPRDLKRALQAVIEGNFGGMSGDTFSGTDEQRLVDTIARTGKADRTRTPHEALKATGRKLYVTDSVVKGMPKGEGDLEVHFFKFDRWISDDDLEKEYAKRGLVPADPYSLAAINEADPAFADECPNCTHWKDASGKWCFAAFNRWNGDRDVLVNRHDYAWNDSWFFAGVRT